MAKPPLELRRVPTLSSGGSFSGRQIAREEAAHLGDAALKRQEHVGGRKEALLLELHHLVHEALALLACSHRQLFVSE